MKLSFFKLPFVVVTGFLFFCILVKGGWLFFLLRSESLSDYVTTGYFVAIRIIPLLPLILFISAITLAKLNVNIVTIKNIFNCLIISLIIFIVMMLVDYVSSYLYPIICYDLRYRDLFFIAPIYSLVSEIVIFIINGFMTFYLIYLCKNNFHRQPDIDYHIEEKISSKFHFRLFMLLFLSLHILVLFQLPNVFIEPDGCVMMFLFPLAIICFLVLIFYVTLRHCFDFTFDSLQVGRIFKSVLFSFFIAFLFNMAIAGILLYQFFLIIFSYQTDQTTAHIIFVGLILVGLILNLIIPRFFAKYYFFNKDKTKNEVQK